VALLASVGVLVARQVWPAAPAAESEGDFALFTHARGELHCPDRELRHLCVPELRRFVDDNEANFQEALECVNKVLDTHRDDFWMLKNMTHLLLDLDGNVHVFDRTNRNGPFINSGFKFAEALMEHPECQADFDEKDEYEGRCVPLYSKIMLLKLKNAGRHEEAKAFYEKQTKIAWDGKNKFAAHEAIRWQDYGQTPQIWVPGLRSQQVWPRETWREDGLEVANLMEKHFDTIKREVNLVLEHAPEEWQETYRFLFDEGDWNQILLYHGKEFRPECEQLFPETCALLRQWLPSKPGMPWVVDQNEQVLILRMMPGTTVEMHSGPSNSILNVHLGIKGLEGAELVVDNETYAWEEGKVIAWDGSFDHSINCVKCKEPRIIMMIRYMHPDVTEDSYKGHTKTHFEDVPKHMW
jgi:aspartate beta-hydroxylase